MTGTPTESVYEYTIARTVGGMTGTAKVSVSTFNDNNLLSGIIADYVRRVANNIEQLLEDVQAKAEEGVPKITTSITERTADKRGVTTITLTGYTHTSKTDLRSLIHRIFEHPLINLEASVRSSGYHVIYGDPTAGDMVH